MCFSWILLLLLGKWVPNECIFRDLYSRTHSPITAQKSLVEVKLGDLVRQKICYLFFLSGRLKTGLTANVSMSLFHAPFDWLENKRPRMVLLDLNRWGLVFASNDDIIVLINIRICAYLHCPLLPQHHPLYHLRPNSSLLA